jgi:hypothetical protein
MLLKLNQAINFEKCNLEVDKKFPKLLLTNFAKLFNKQSLWKILILM